MQDSTRAKISELATLAGECKGRLVGKAVRDFVRGTKLTRMDFWFPVDADFQPFMKIVNPTGGFATLETDDGLIDIFIEKSAAPTPTLGSEVDDLFMNSPHLYTGDSDDLYLLKLSMINYRHNSIPIDLIHQRVVDEELTITNTKFSVHPIDSLAEWAAGYSILRQFD